jgi:hypothetical protein
MEIKYHTSQNNTLIAELNDSNFVIKEVQDVLELIYEAGTADCGRIIIRKSNLDAGFFNLKSGLAGEILQKFSNYRVKLAIIGDFSVYKSKSLQDFIRECNKGNMIFFFDSLESAILRLSK